MSTRGPCDPEHPRQNLAEAWVNLMGLGVKGKSAAFKGIPDSEQRK